MNWAAFLAVIGVGFLIGAIVAFDDYNSIFKRYKINPGWFLLFMLLDWECIYDND